MAITRRQFVTRLSTLAAAMGVSQVDLAKVTEAFAHSTAGGNPWNGNWADKPKVIWVHGAECTGCSTSLLSLFEDARGTAVEGTSYTTIAALDLAVSGTGNGAKVLNADIPNGHPYGHRTIVNSAAITGCDFDQQANVSMPDEAYIVNIADVLIDFIDLQYHETIMGMGGDLAYKYLKDAMDDGSNYDASGNFDGVSAPYVLVVEGAIQPQTEGGYWGATGAAPWCSIGMNGTTFAELSFDDVVADLAMSASCAAVVAIGQCATFGGYPGCVSPVMSTDASGNVTSMTGALGTYDFLSTHTNPLVQAAAAKVINVPGCPTNPWWFVLTVVIWLVDATAILNGGTGPLGVLGAGLSINASAVDSTRRLNMVYGLPLHGPWCHRYPHFVAGNFASHPGDAGCLQGIGCKGMSTNTLCGAHGWNSTNPHNDPDWDSGVGSVITNLNGARVGGNCVAGGHPCMGCTEKGYPDSMLPFVAR